MSDTRIALLLRLNHASGIPLYLQLMEQIKHAIEMGALEPGDQLPTIRSLAEELVMNPNTVARAYRELEHEGVIELKHGLGAFVAESMIARTKVMRKAQALVQATIERLIALGLGEDEMRRLVENELALLRVPRFSKGSHE
ncbi:MAG TPA: GntR family transcriptional regulator [Bryobacteraceae bacterium]|nr:GntR family transcriptional regulator [Bryobacteraceae bacterium]